MTGEETEQPVAPPKGKEPETVTLTKAEVDALKRERDEARESERFWAQRARGGNPAPEPEQEEEPIETDGLVPEPTGNEELDAAIFEDPEKWTEALTKGPKAIGSYIKSLGLVSAKEAAEIAVKAARGVVDSRWDAIQSSNKLITEYPDMAQSGADGGEPSELFRTASPIYQRLVKMNGNKHSNALIFAAAGQAKAILDAKKPAKQAHDDDDPYSRYEPEEDRRARARAQGSDRGRPAPVVDDGMDDLGPEALAICKAMDIKPEDFVASQKQLGRRRK